MSKTFNQFQNDVSGTASAIVTQMICAERGINYADVQQMAQQAHVNGILQAEQQRQMNQVINRHYQGTSIVSKVREVFGGQPSNFLAPQPQGFGLPMAQPVMQPQIAAPNPFAFPAHNAPQQIAQHIAQPQFQQQPVQQQAPSVTADDLAAFQAVIQGVVAALAPQQQAQPPVNQYPQYTQQPPFAADAPTVAGTQDV